MTCTRRITRITTAALGALAILAPAASAVPIRDVGTPDDGEQTAAPHIERAGRNPHGAWVPPRAAPAAPAQNTRLPDFRVQPNTKHEPGRPSRPANREQVSPAPVDAAGAGGSGDHSPLIYILPGLVALATLAVGAGYAIHTSGRARRAGMGA